MAGYLVADWGTDTPVRKTNNETGFFAWDGYTNGQKNPSGEYTYLSKLETESRF